MEAINLVGPHGYIHGWIKVGSDAHTTLDSLRYESSSAIKGHMDAAWEARQRGDLDTARRHLGYAADEALKQGVPSGVGGGGTPGGPLYKAIKSIDVGGSSGTPVRASYSKQEIADSDEMHRLWWRQRAAEDAGNWAESARLDAQMKAISSRHPQGWSNVLDAIEMSARTAMLERTPAPAGKPGGPGLYDVKGMGHSDYFQQVVKALKEKRGMSDDKAYAIAWGAMRKWSRGGGHVHPEVRAAAGRSLAEEEAKAARARAAHGHANAVPAVELVGPHGYIHGWIKVQGTPDPLAGLKYDRHRVLGRDAHGGVFTGVYDHGRGQVVSTSGTRHPVTHIQDLGPVRPDFSAEKFMNETWNLPIGSEHASTGPAIELDWRTEKRGEHGEWVGALGELAGKLDSDHPGKGLGDHVRQARDAVQRGDIDAAGRHLQAAQDTLRGHEFYAGGRGDETYRKAAGNSSLLGDHLKHADSVASESEASRGHLGMFHRMGAAIARNIREGKEPEEQYNLRPGEVRQGAMFERMAGREDVQASKGKLGSFRNRSGDMAMQDIFGKRISPKEVEGLAEMYGGNKPTKAERRRKAAYRQAHGFASGWPAIELAIELFNPAGNPGQARVPSGQAGGGQFTVSGSGSGSTVAPKGAQNKPGKQTSTTRLINALNKAQLRQVLMAWRNELKQLEALLAQLKAGKISASAAQTAASSASRAATAAVPAAAKAAAASATTAAKTTATAAKTTAAAAKTAAPTTASMTSQISSQIASLKTKIAAGNARLAAM